MYKNWESGKFENGQNYCNNSRGADGNFKWSGRNLASDIRGDNRNRQSFTNVVKIAIEVK